MITGTREQVLQAVKDHIHSVGGRQWFAATISSQLMQLKDGCDGWLSFYGDKTPDEVHVFILPEECLENAKEFHQLSDLF